MCACTALDPKGRKHLNLTKVTNKSQDIIIPETLIRQKIPKLLFCGLVQVLMRFGTFGFLQVENETVSAHGKR